MHALAEEGDSVTTWFLRKRMQFNKVSRSAKKSARNLGIKAYPKTLMNDDVSGQVSLLHVVSYVQIHQVALSRDSDLVMVATDTPETPGRVIRDVISSAKYDVGVLIVPHEKKTPRINKILCSLLRTKNDPYVVKYATMMAQSQDLHILLMHLNKPGTHTNQEEVNQYTKIATKFSSMKVQFCSQIIFLVQEYIF